MTDEVQQLLGKARPLLSKARDGTLQVNFDPSISMACG